MTVDRVLCVDDEPNVLSGLERNLRKICPVVTADSGAKALEVLRGDRDFAVIVSDMRMPGMTGAQFLAEARLLVPNAVRILLTGEADLDAVIAAVNAGNIHHYLRKPVERDDLVRLIQRAFMAHHDARRDDERLRQSLRHGVRLALEVLRLTAPHEASHAERSGVLATKLGAQLDLGSLDALELTAQLFIIGRRLPFGVAAQVSRDLLGDREEFGGVRSALDELWQTEGSSLRGSVISKVVTAACLIDQLTRSTLTPAEIDALLERGLDSRVLQAARALGPLEEIGKKAA